MSLKNIDNNIFLHAGDSGLIVDFSADDVDVATIKARRLGQMIGRDSEQFRGVRDTIAGLNNLLIQFDPLQTSLARLKPAILNLLPHLSSEEDESGRRWLIPVCYEGDYAPDLQEVAAATTLSPDEIVSLHTGNILSVAIMGFLPGLGYLKGIDEKLYLPRKSTPRRHVPALSVGIAMDQTVIYPLPSPGGWNLVGRTPVRLFDTRRAEPVLLTAGDEVQFTAISQAEFSALDEAASAGESIISPQEGKA